MDAPVRFDGASELRQGTRRPVSDLSGISIHVQMTSMRTQGNTRRGGIVQVADTYQVDK